MEVGDVVAAGVCDPVCNRYRGAEEEEVVVAGVCDPVLNGNREERGSVGTVFVDPVLSGNCCVGEGGELEPRSSFCRFRDIPVMIQGTTAPVQTRTREKSFYSDPGHNGTCSKRNKREVFLQ